jgi:hypothetical protein
MESYSADIEMLMSGWNTPYIHCITNHAYGDLAPETGLDENSLYNSGYACWLIPPLFF